MKKYRCCVCDLDGTLLNSNNYISDGDLNALLALKRTGVPITIATGRSILQINEYIAKLEIDIPVIACNGGVVRNPITQSDLHVTYINPQIAEQITKFCYQKHLDFLMYTPDYIYHCPWSSRIDKFRTYNKTAPLAFRVPIKNFAELSYPEGLNQVMKILITDDVSMLNEVILQFNTDQSLAIVTSGFGLIDIMASGTSKGNALSILADDLGISLSQIVVFGDSPNDESMFQAAGYAVAMENASQSIKELSRFVTKSNDNLGVAYGIAHVFGIEDYSA